MEIEQAFRESPFFSIIIPVFNSLFYLRKLLSSILNSKFSLLEVIIIDNGSNDGTEDFIKKNYPFFLYRKLSRNFGFPKAVNEGVKLSKGKYILVMNADIIIEKKFFSNFYRRINKSPDIGMWQPLILYPEGRKIYSKGLYISRARRFYNIGEGKIYNGEKKEEEIFGPSGCCAIYKRELMEDIKIKNEYFDEDFFFLLEDFDLAWRARRKGWKTIYYPGAVAYHFGRITFSNLFRQYLTFRNRYLIIIKNESLRKIIKDFPYILPYEFLRLPFFLFYNPYSFVAFKEIFKLIPKMREKRKCMRKFPA